MENNLNEELLKQLLLMNFDRGKTLSEQKVMPSDRLGSQGDFQPLKPIKSNYEFLKSFNSLSPQQQADNIYRVIKKEIDTTGTDEELILSTLRLVNVKNYPYLLNKVKKIKGFDTREKHFDDKGDSYTIKRNYKSVIEWIQQNEFGAGEIGHDEDSRFWVSPRDNKMWLKQYEAILSKFGDDSTDMWDNFDSFDEMSAMVGGDRIGDYDGPELTATEWLHVLLPLGALVIGMVFPPTWAALAAASLLELGDAALYYSVDKDPYAAGLSAICAFIPFAQLKFLPTVYKLGKTGLQKLLQKVILKEGNFIDEELKALKEINENYQRLSKLSKLNMVQKLTLLKLRSLKSAKDFLKWTTKLIDNGLLNPESLGQTGLLVGGSFYTWDKIAAVNGICNPSPLSRLSQSDWKILKGIGYAGEFLQSSSDPCDLIEYQKLLEKHNNLNVITAILQKESDDGTVFNQNYNGVYSLPIYFIQKVLKAGGFDKNLPKPMWSFNNKKLLVKDGSMIKKIRVFTVAGTLKKEYNNTDKKNNFTFDINGLSDAVYIVSFLNYDGTSDVSKLFYLTGNQWKSFPQSSNIGSMKEGYYDKRTELAVRDYQKKKGLNVDGLAGKETIKSIISDYKSAKYGLNKEELNTFDLEKERVKLIQKEFNTWKSDIESKSKSGQLSMEKVEQAYKEDTENKDKTQKFIYDNLNAVVTDSTLTKEFTDIMRIK
jgi:peptidoglycan hydrolase-like protein with peptidoglycan-binding domain